MNTPNDIQSVIDGKVKQIETTMCPSEIASYFEELGYTDEEAQIEFNNYMQDLSKKTANALNELKVAMKELTGKEYDAPIGMEEFTSQLASIKSGKESYETYKERMIAMDADSPDLYDAICNFIESIPNEVKKRYILENNPYVDGCNLSKWRQDILEEM
jgi:hypothetical protein